ncbi:MAG: hypothetical protein V3W19_05950 [Desulfatiglandales bacterium]
MSHEKTITVEIDGKHYNIPTVIGGKTYGVREAARIAIKNKGLGRGYLNLKNAVDAAKKRSKGFNKLDSTKKSSKSSRMHR